MTDETDTSAEAVEFYQPVVSGNGAAGMTPCATGFWVTADDYAALAARLAEVAAERDQSVTELKLADAGMTRRAEAAEAKLEKALKSLDGFMPERIGAGISTDVWALHLAQLNARVLIDADQPAPRDGVTAAQAARDRVARAIWDTLQSDYTFDEARSGEECATHAQAIKWVFDVADAALRALAGGE
jgi:hypothetical protein